MFGIDRLSHWTNKLDIIFVGRESIALTVAQTVPQILRHTLRSSYVSIQASHTRYRGGLTWSPPVAMENHLSAGCNSGSANRAQNAARWS